MAKGRARPGRRAGPGLERVALLFVLHLLLPAGVAEAGDAKTPLGKWMKPNVGAPFAAQDFATVAQSLTLVSTKPPPSGDYGQWSAIASAGASAASSQDPAGTKASCKKCHDLYKQKYVADFPALPFP
jgi:hypothetical protein